LDIIKEMKGKDDKVIADGKTILEAGEIKN
jgi:hypothetical protein